MGGIVLALAKNRLVLHLRTANSNPTDGGQYCPPARHTETTEDRVPALVCPYLGGPAEAAHADGTAVVETNYIIWWVRHVETTLSSTVGNALASTGNCAVPHPADGKFPTTTDGGNIALRPTRKQRVRMEIERPEHYAHDSTHKSFVFFGPRSGSPRSCRSSCRPCPARFRRCCGW
jgi:hypothetical protein